MGALLEELAAELAMAAAELEQILLDGGSEALSPTYLQANPDGTISAVFSGHIVASGIDLSAGPSPNVLVVNFIEWLRSTDAQRVALAYGWESSADGHREAAFGTTIAGATGIDTGIQALRDGTGPNPTPRVLAQAGNVQARQLLDNTGASDFAQVAGGPRALAFNIGEVVVPAGGSASVAHGLPRNLAGAQLAAHFNGGAVPFAGSYEYPGVDNAHLTIHNQGPAQTNVAFLVYG